MTSSAINFASPGGAEEPGDAHLLLLSRCWEEDEDDVTEDDDDEKAKGKRYDRKDGGEKREVSPPLSLLWITCKDWRRR